MTKRLSTWSDAVTRRERVEDAYQALQSVHAGLKTEDEQQIQQQFSLDHAQIQQEANLATSFRDLFTHSRILLRGIDVWWGYITCFAGQATATMVIARKI